MVHLIKSSTLGETVEFRLYSRRTYSKNIDQSVNDYQKSFLG